jgi:hypothetical protein
MYFSYQGTPPPNIQLARPAGWDHGGSNTVHITGHSDTYYHRLARHKENRIVSSSTQGRHDIGQ